MTKDVQMGGNVYVRGHEYAYGYEGENEDDGERYVRKKYVVDEGELSEDSCGGRKKLEEKVACLAAGKHEGRCAR